MTEIDKFLTECTAVSLGSKPEIAGLRKRSVETGLSLAKMRLVAAAASIQIVADGKELKAVPFSF